VYLAYMFLPILNKPALCLVGMPVEEKITPANRPVRSIVRQKRQEEEEREREKLARKGEAAAKAAKDKPSHSTSSTNGRSSLSGKHDDPLDDLSSLSSLSDAEEKQTKFRGPPRKRVKTTTAHRKPLMDKKAEPSSALSASSVLAAAHKLSSALLPTPPSSQPNTQASSLTSPYRNRASNRNESSHVYTSPSRAIASPVRTPSKARIHSFSEDAWDLVQLFQCVVWVKVDPDPLREPQSLEEVSYSDSPRTAFWWPGVMITSASSRPIAVELFRDRRAEIDKFV
jgi:hypothetical protein